MYIVLNQVSSPWSTKISFSNVNTVKKVIFVLELTKKWEFTYKRTVNLDSAVKNFQRMNKNEVQTFPSSQIKWPMLK